METIKNRYDFVYLFDVKDGNPNGDPDFDNMPRTDEETNQGLVTDVCIKRKVRNYVHLLKGLASPYDIFIREGNILNPLIQEKRDTFARSIDPVFSKSHSVTRCCITKEKDAEDKNNTIGNKNNVSYGLYRMHGFISATDAAKTGFSEEDKALLFEALTNAFENDRAAARGEMNPRALIVFKHDSPLGNARSGQLFDLVQVTCKENVEFPRSFNDYEVVVPSDEDLKKIHPGVTIEELI